MTKQALADGFSQQPLLMLSLTLALLPTPIPSKKAKTTRLTRVSLSKRRRLITIIGVDSVSYRPVDNPPQFMDSSSGLSCVSDP